MMATTHQMIALLAALWLLIQYPISPGITIAILTIIAVMIGALTPDLDQPTANIWKRVLGGRAVGNMFQWFSGGHRHMTHSLIGITLIGWATHWIATNLISPEFTRQALVIWTGFMIGYISHPIGDTLTDQGVPWLWPFHLKIKIPPGPEEVRVTTDSWVERLIVRGGLIVAMALLLTQHWQVLKNFLLG